MAGRSSSHGPVQTSAVVVLGAPQCPAVPPPSPPTPSISPPESALCNPIDQLSLDQESEDSQRVRNQRLHDGLHVMNTEAIALRNLTRLYETNSLARDGFSRAVEVITQQEATRGKIVVIGVGKSGYIGQKLVATFKSLAIHAVFLHPTEALHGDLGIIGPHDTLMFITFSGKTQELLLILPHIEPSLPVILLTSHTTHDTCEFMKHRPDAILLPAPIPEPEKVSFGVSAPTTSTTMALAVGDALAIASAKELHMNVSSVFAKNHPGGAIGAALGRRQTLGDISIPWGDISSLAGSSDTILGIDLLRAGYDSQTGWIRVDDKVASPSKIRTISSTGITQIIDQIPGLLASKEQMISLSSNTSIRQAKDILRNMQATPTDEEIRCEEASILAIMEKGEIVGVLEAGKLLAYQDG